MVKIQLCLLTVEIYWSDCAWLELIRLLRTNPNSSNVESVEDSINVDRRYKARNVPLYEERNDHLQYIVSQSVMRHCEYGR